MRDEADIDTHALAIQARCVAINALIERELHEMDNTEGSILIVLGTLTDDIAAGAQRILVETGCVSKHNEVSL